MFVNNDGCGNFFFNHCTIKLADQTTFSSSTYIFNGGTYILQHNIPVLQLDWCFFLMLLMTNLFFVNTIHHDIIVLILLLSQKLSKLTVLSMLSHISLSNVIFISTLSRYSPLSRFAVLSSKFLSPMTPASPRPPRPFSYSVLLTKICFPELQL